MSGSGPRRRPAAPAVLTVLVVLALLASAGTGSALAMFTKQATVTANTVGTGPAFPRCYPDAVVADNPVSSWRLDEASGTTAADSKGTNPGTYTNGPSLNQTGALPDTINNRAAGFDGTDDYVSIPYAAALSPAQFTVEAWAKLTGGVANYPTVAGSYYEMGSTLRGYWLGIGNDNRWWLQLSNGSGYTNVIGPIVASNTWTHVVGTYDGTVGRLYVNGTLVASATGGYVVNPSSPFAIGAYPLNGSWDGFFPGQIDDVAVYNTALTAAQVRTQYNTGRCYRDEVLRDSPVGYWRLGEAAGTTASDGIRGQHGTYTNGPTLNQTGALSGDTNKAVSFDGTDDRVVVPYDATLNPAQFTVEAWIKPTLFTGAYPTAVSSWYESASASRGYKLEVNAGNNWRLVVGRGGNLLNIDGSAATLGAWAHVVGTYDGTTAKLYVNGILAGSAATSYAANSADPFSVGAWYDNYLTSWLDSMQGQVDEVAVYAAALSQARVQAHYLIGRSYRDTVLDSKPVSYWRLGESSGTSAADAAVTNAGSYVNGPTLAQDGAVAGDADTSTRFDGVNQHVSIPYSAGLNTANFTLEAWAKPTGGAGTWRALVDSWYERPQGSVPFLGYGIWATDTDFWQGLAGYGGAFTTINGPSVVLNTWTHLVETFDGTTLRLYVNGTQAASGTVSGYSANTSAPLLIGVSNYGSVAEPFPGVIDEVAVYNTVLTPTQIQLHYDSGRQ